MNFKKIIPLTLATMSVMGAFTACSDKSPENNIVGVDEQPNTMSEVKTLFGNVVSSDVQRAMLAKYKEDSKSNGAVSAILAHDSTFQLNTIKTIDGDEFYNNEINRILSMGDIDTTYVEYKGWDYYSMLDENGVLHGPISISHSVLAYDVTNNVGCVNENKWFIEDNEVYRISEYYSVSVGFGNVQMRLQTRDSLLTAQFIEDCNAENGIFSEYKGNRYYILGEAHVESWINCVMQRDNPYKDPHWVKYASYIINNCRSDVVSY